jgi:hypothetical protein
MGCQRYSHCQLTIWGKRVRLEEANRASRRLSRSFHCFAIWTIAVLVMAGGGDGRGQVQHDGGHTLGTVDFPISCSEQAQAEFSRAVALLHHMTYPQAREAFE